MQFEEAPLMRAIPIVLLLGVAILAGCETTPPAGADAKPAAQAAASQSRCEKREVTGSRLTRCDSGPSDVRAITREEIEATGMPTGGPGKGSGDGR
jgi:predicted small secreted protein